jgi:hypothetical protein
VDAAPTFDAPMLDVIPDVSGTFLIGLTNDLLAGTMPIRFLSTQTVVNTGGTYKVTLSFQPLDKTTLLPVGTPANFPEVTVGQTGEFTVALPGELVIPAEADTLTQAAIVSNGVVVHGRITSEDNHCGTLEGNVTAPIPADLAAQHTTYGAIRVTSSSPPFPPTQAKCTASSAVDAGTSD